MKKLAPRSDVRPNDPLRTLVRVVFGVWAVAMTGLGALLLSKHAIALPAPAKDDSTLAAAVGALPADGAAFSALHVLYAKCRCSQRIVDHLTSSKRPADVRERVLLVADDGTLTARLERAGFVVIPVTTEALRDHYHVEAAPLFIVSDRDGRVRYAGGYTREKQGEDVRDLEIVAELRDDGRPAALPTLGCPVSDELRAALDPLGLN